MSKNSQQVHEKLDQFSATAIAGNDILSSCLYVCGIATLFAGVYAPLVFLVIGMVLFFYKFVYSEVVEALPLNGGAYNCLLNATSKPRAAVAGVMTMLSYVATSVISAKTAAEYLHTVWHGLPVMPVTAGIIVVFALLVILGVKDSARVAKVIFSLHIFTLTLLVSMGLLKIVNGDITQLLANVNATELLWENKDKWQMLFFAFSASLLGVSGYESSANFVEEQEKGVFRKTLRNMLLGVAIFNPLIALVLLNTLNLDAIFVAKDFVLADVGISVGGMALKYLIVVDAFLVLSGAVLASFVGASGLLYRMTLDQCFPSKILLPKLKNRNQNANRIIIAFALLCLSILFVTGGSLLSLAGVYTISFLGVMSLFALGNIILRSSRDDLKRPYKAPIFFSVLAFIFTATGIIGNVMIDPKNLQYFLLYFVPSISIVMFMIYRDYILEFLLKIFKKLPFLYNIFEPVFDEIIKHKIILFAHHPAKLFKSLEYIRKNETSRNITIVFCSRNTRDSKLFTAQFISYIKTFKTANIFPMFKIEFILEDKLEFEPETVRTYSKRYRIGRNNIFIGSIHEQHDFTFEDLGGVRIIQ